MEALVVMSLCIGYGQAGGLLKDDPGVKVLQTPCLSDSLI